MTSSHRLDNARYGISGVVCCLITLPWLGRSPVKAQNRKGAEPIVQTLTREWDAGSKALHDDQTQAALTHFDRVLSLLNRLQPPAPRKVLAAAYQYRANAHYGLEQWKLAVDDYSRCIGLSPRNAEAYSLRGVARKATGDYNGLLDDAQKAAQIDPQYVSFLDDARSTVLWRRVLLSFFVLAMILLTFGGFFLVRDLSRILKAPPAT